MQRFIFSFLVILAACISAQAQRTLVHYQNGEMRSFPYEEYTRISFSTTAHDPVDMGVSVLWSPVNVSVEDDDASAQTPVDYGTYTGWGDPTGQKTSTKLSDYGGYEAPDDITGTDLDIATKQWGGGWRLPTKAEWQELKDNCEWTWTTFDGINGYNVVAKNGNSIFLPAAGMRDNGNKTYVNQYGCYWSSNLYTDMPGNAYYLAFFNMYSTFSYCGRSYGLSVRPVIATDAEWGTSQTVAPKVVLHAENRDVFIPRKQITSIEFDSDEDHSRESVDLGLSVEWATVNFDLAAQDCACAKPENRGGFYGWADPTGKKTSRDFEDYGGSKPQQNICGSDLDIVTLYWGNDWRLPSDAEFTELAEKCEWTYMETTEDLPGYKVTGPNGNSIFLPCAGTRTDEEIFAVGEMGCYWTGTLSPYDTALQYAMVMWFTPEKVARHDAYRFSGNSIRPVRNK